MIDIFNKTFKAKDIEKFVANMDKYEEDFRKGLEQVPTDENDVPTRGSITFILRWEDD